MIKRRKRQILEFLKEAGKVSAVILFPKSLSFGKHKLAGAFRKLLGADSLKNRDDIYRRKQAVYITLYQLKKEGLVARKGEKGEDVWQITKKGKEILKKQVLNKIPPDGKVRLFIFDVPEFESRKRRWLRNKLRAYSYEPLQKSVWRGNCPLPEEFIEELKDLDLLGCIHIFGLGEQGTLRELRV